MKCLHTADWHSRDKDLPEIEKCLNFLVNTAIIEKPDLIIHSGDFFHSRDIKAESAAAKLVMKRVSELADIAPIAAVQGTPLHDGRVPEILALVRGTYPIHVSTQPEQIYLLDGKFTAEIPEPPYEPEVIISLCPQPTKEYWSQKFQSSVTESDMEIGAAMSGVFAGFGGMAAPFRAPHIVCLHGTLRGARLFNNTQMIGREIEIGRDQLELCRADLYLCGHIHLNQEVYPRMFYSGSVYQVDIGEAASAHGFWIHDLMDNGEWESVFHVTPTKKTLRAPADMTGVESIDSTLYMHLCSFSTDEIKDASVRVEIKIYQDQAAELDKEKIQEFFTDQGATEVDLRIIRVPRETVRSAEVTRATGLPEKVSILAKTRGEEVPEGVLSKAHDLEAMPAEKILERVGH